MQYLVYNKCLRALINHFSPSFKRYNIRGSLSKTRFTLGFNFSYPMDILFRLLWLLAHIWFCDYTPLSYLFPKLGSNSCFSEWLLIINNYGPDFLSLYLCPCFTNTLIYSLHSPWCDKMDSQSERVLFNLTCQLDWTWSAQIFGQTFWCFCEGVIELH